MLTDRVRAVGTVWLGQTLGCCQCHDHKFDPITSRDFYSMGAFFADIQEPILGRREEGMLLSDPRQAAELAHLDAEIGGYEKQLATATPELAAAQKAWEATVLEALKAEALKAQSQPAIPHPEKAGSKPVPPSRGESGKIPPKVAESGKSPPKKIVEVPKKTGDGSKKVELPKEIVDLLKIPSEKRSDPQRLRLAQHYRGIAPQLAQVRTRLELARKAKLSLEAGIPRCLVSVSASNPRTVRLLPRGNWMNESGPVMQPAVPAFLPGPKVQGRHLTRLDLARWLVSRGNPLTARVFVNRLWKQFFGTGICRTLDDLGSQGEWPANPQLLDWLACEFIDSGWNVKHVIRTIVTSRTYRQTSIASARKRWPATRTTASWLAKAVSGWTLSWSATTPCRSPASWWRRSAVRASSPTSRRAIGRI